MDERAIREELRAWILERAGAPWDRLPRDDLAIVDDGLLSSLDVVEFILFIEDLRGEEVDIDRIEPDAFTNIDTLVEAFFPNVRAAAS